MRSVINANCPTCGDVLLDPKDVTLVLWTDTDLQRYSFTCPSCEQVYGRNTSARIVDLLIGAGVVPQAPAPEALERHDGPPLTLDDVLSLHRILHDKAVGL